MEYQCCQIYYINKQRQNLIGNLNPFMPSVVCFDSILRRDHQKISYERRDYESVDEIEPVLD